MPKKARALTAREIAGMKGADAAPGLYAVGGVAGLYLQVAPGQGRSWVLRYQYAGNRRDMGLGSLDTFGLAKARERAIEVRQKIAQGIDPIAERKATKAASKTAAAKAITFAQCLDAYITSHRAGWRSSKSEAQWRQSLNDHVCPTFGDLPVEAIDTGLVMRALEPLWTAKPETAGRVRGRVEAVLDWATVRGHRTGDNPARWRGHLDKLLPKKSKVHRVEHLAALPYTEIGEFMGELRALDGVSARALEFLILTATRNSEVAQARWSEINIAERIWTIPADRMKGGREHRVPLSDAAMAIIEEMAAIRTGEFVFPGRQPGHYLSSMALIMALRRMKRGDLAAHGFRSSFRDWAAERTAFPSEIAEQALAHVAGGAAERAYRRGDALEKRRQLMESWARHCTSPAPTGDVVPLRGAAHA